MLSLPREILRMTMTCNCGQRLDESVTTITNGERLKSCPTCSQREGMHQFYRDDAFGYRDYKGRRYIQSHCQRCRNEQPPLTPVATC